MVWVGSELSHDKQKAHRQFKVHRFRMDGTEGADNRKWQNYNFEFLHCARLRKARTAENTTVSNAAVAASDW